jgi:integrase
MASVISDPKGRKRIQFVAGDGSRKTLRLGKATLRQAEAIKPKIEQLALAATGITGVIDDETAKWLTGLDEAMYDKLARIGLVEARTAQSEQQKFTVGQWVNQYIERRTDVKTRTKSNWQNAAKKLSEFFSDQLISEVTIQQAKEFRVYLKSVAGLNENTLRREIGLARQFFNAAIDAELITKNPFRGQPVSVRANPARFYYVTQETALKILEACPDVQWRLIFGLARWGGLRCPSEVLRLKWQDVDFEHSRFIVHASKTAHHADSGIRTVPIFPELRPLFQDAFDNAQDGDVFCITRYRDKSVNLRTRLTKYIRRAGFEPWPKLFQNLRSTRETELFKMTNGNIKAVCSWIGNSPKVALEHYAQVTEADLKEAAKMSLLSDGEKAAQNAAQYDAAKSRKAPQTALNEYQESAFLPLNATLCGSVHGPQVPPRGVETIITRN